MTLCFPVPKLLHRCTFLPPCSADISCFQLAKFFDSLLKGQRESEGNRRGGCTGAVCRQTCAQEAKERKNAGDEGVGRNQEHAATQPSHPTTGQLRALRRAGGSSSSAAGYLCTGGTSGFMWNKGVIQGLTWGLWWEGPSR